jgi:hypothetical protein
MTILASIHQAHLGSGDAEVQQQFLHRMGIQTSG